MFWLKNNLNVFQSISSSQLFLKDLCRLIQRHIDTHQKRTSTDDFGEWFPKRPWAVFSRSHTHSCLTLLQAHLLPMQLWDNLFSESPWKQRNDEINPSILRNPHSMRLRPQVSPTESLVLINFFEFTCVPDFPIDWEKWPVSLGTITIWSNFFTGILHVDWFGRLDGSSILMWIILTRHKVRDSRKIVHLSIHFFFWHSLRGRLGCRSYHAQTYDVFRARAEHRIGGINIRLRRRKAAKSCCQLHVVPLSVTD